MARVLGEGTAATGSSPFVGFALSKGLAGTRSEAADRRPEFEAWMGIEYVDIEADDWIDPRYVLEWQRSLSVQTSAPRDAQRVDAELTGTDGRREKYRTHPDSSLQCP